VHLIREGFNRYAVDYGRPDLQLVGTPGGRAFADYVRSRFRDGEVEYVRVSNNPYFRGMRRREGAKRDWFPTIQGA
jgi:hypothetical protein